MKIFPSMKLGSLLYAILLMLSFSSCNSKEKELKTGWWKYGQGFHLGDDVLILKDSNLRNDTILIGQKPVAIILSVSSHEIKIASIPSGETGIYFHK